MEWSELVMATGEASPYIGDILEKGFGIAQAVVVFLTPDDEVRLRAPYRKTEDPPYEAELTPQARPNVLFEAGLAFATHSTRTVIIQVGKLRPFSDIAGRHIIHMNGGTVARQEIAQRLKSAGCMVNLDGTRWHSAGDFTLRESETPVVQELELQVLETNAKEPIRVNVTGWSKGLASAGQRRKEYRALSYNVLLSADEVNALKTSYPNVSVETLVDDNGDGTFELLAEDQELRDLGLIELIERIAEVIRQVESAKARGK